MTSDSSPVGSVLVTVGQITQLATMAVSLFTLFRQARDKWQTDNPGGTSAFLTDAALIDALDVSSDALVAAADRLLAKYQTPAVPPANPVP